MSLPCEDLSVSCNGCASSCTGKQSCQPVGWRLDIGKVFRLLAIVSLVVAYFVGRSINQPSWQEDIQGLYPQAQVVASETLENTWEIQQGDETLLMTLTTENSYAGPLTLGTLMNNEGMILGVEILDHSDTPAYIQRLVNQFFFRQFENQPVDHHFVAGENYGAISGATLSSDAIMRANATAAHYIAREVHGKNPVSPESEVKLDYFHFLVAGLIVLALVNIKLKNRHLKTAIILASLVVTGFIANQMISVATFSAILQGFVPGMAENPGFWLLVGSVLASIILLGRNIYCGNLCPFFSVQFLLAKVSGLNLPLHPLVKRYGKTMAKVGLWAGLMIGFLTANPTSGAYEPFGMIFSLQGEGIQWYILPSVVIACFFIPQYVLSLSLPCR